jgi:hypothetical protein
MIIGTAVALIVVGAILRFAITTSVHGIAIHAIGDILMIVGVIGVVLWLIVWAPRARRRRVVYRQDVPPEEVPAPPTRRHPADSPYEDEYRR